MESLPIYVEGQAPQDPFDALLTRISAPLLARHPGARVALDSFVEKQRAPTYNAADSPPDCPPPIDMHSPDSSCQDYSVLLVQQAIVNELFNAITREDKESIALLIQRNMLSPNVKNNDELTPLLAAISTRKIGIVRQLLELGADPNLFGKITLNGEDQVAQETRTPLMLAAMLGSLPIVRLLVEDFSADHTLIAPDGQIALRLAAERNHQPIVEYLPSLRAGGYLRFRTRNARNIERAKRALRSIYEIAKFFLWDIPKFFLWSIPKHLVVLPGIRVCKWGWANRKRFGRWCKRQAVEIPKRIWRGVKKIPDILHQMWNSILQGLKKLGPILRDFVKSLVTAVIDFIKSLPETIANVARTMWNFFTQTLPLWLKNFATWLWDIIKRIPKAVQDVVEWIWEVIKSLARAIRAILQWFLEVVKSSAKAIWEFLSSIMSFLHTVLIAVITFLRNATLRDIWNAFCRILRSIFIEIPKTIWSIIKNLSTVLYKVMDALFGWFGRALWEIGAALLRIITYIPKKLWTVLESVGDSMGKAAYEIRVWINPKV